MRNFGLKVLVCAAVALSAASFAGESGVRERTFVRALEAFDKAKTPDDFRQSAALFESLIADDYQNGAVYYNVGNAFMRSGDYGRAIVAYRKAKVYRPRDPCLDANLRQALSVAPGRLPDPPVAWWRNIFFWSGWVSYPDKFRFALGAWAAGALLATLGLLLRSRRTYTFCGVALFVAALLSVDAAVGYCDANLSQHAVIISETTARKGNGLNWDPAFNQPLKDGAELTIKERRGEWVRGEFGSIGEGWVPQKCVAE